jgi:thiol:disulfide interchange protein
LKNQSQSGRSLQTASQIAATVALAGLALAPVSAQTTAKKTAKAPPQIAWQTDFNKAFKQAKKQHKLLMLDFYTDWCGYCKRLDREVYTDEKVRALSQKFIPVKLNPERDQVAAAIAQQVGVRGFPSVLFITEKAELVHGIGGFEPASYFTQDMELALKRARSGPAGQSRTARR